MSKLIQLTVIFLLVNFSSEITNAGLVVSAVGVSASDERVFGSTTYFASSLIDQSGLSAPFTSGSTNFEAYISADPTHRYFQSGNTVSGWATNNGVTNATLDFDLGGATLLDAFVLWNRRDGFSNQIGNFELFASNDASFVNLNSLGAFSATGNNTDLATGAQVFTFSEISTQYIRMSITSSLPGGSILSAGEIAFGSGVTAVPEPSTLITLGIVASIAGFRFRRR